MDPPLTQDDAKRLRLEAEGALGSPAASGPAGAASGPAGAACSSCRLYIAPAATDGAPGGPLLLAELENEEGDGLPEDGFCARRVHVR